MTAKTRTILQFALFALLASESATLPLQAAAARQPKPLLASNPFLAARRVASPPQLTAASVASQPPASSGAGVGPSIVNLAKNIVGSGVLALAAGVAAFSGSPVALIPSLVVLAVLGAISGYSFTIIARVGDAVKSSTYRDTFAKVFGEKTAIIPDITTVFMTCAAALSYAIIIGESFSSIASLAGATGLLATPNAWIVLISALVLLPLCLLRDLSSLAIGSVLGTAGTLFTAAFVTLRCFDGSYAPGGKFYSMVAPALQPKFVAATAAAPIMNLKIFVLISMLATAYLAHYNAPKFYTELAAPEDGSSKLPRFNTVVAGAFGLAILLCGTIMAGGFLTFGAASQGLILNNYATADTLAFLARIGIGASIIFSYPLNFAGLREGFLGILNLRDKAHRNDVHVISTLVLLCSMNGLALVVKNLGLVASLGGAVLGSALVYIYPALMFIGNALQQKGKAGSEPVSKVELVGNYVMVALGVFLAGVGSVMSIKSA